MPVRFFSLSIFQEIFLNSVAFLFMDCPFPLVLIAMSCFKSLCDEVEIRATDDFAVTTLLPNYQIYQELSAATGALTTGRAQLQKRIMSLLRRIDKNTPSILSAWDETHLCKFSVQEVIPHHPPEITER